MDNKIVFAENLAAETICTKEEKCLICYTSDLRSLTSISLSH